MNRKLPRKTNKASKELDLELAFLRSVLRDTAEHYSLRAESMIVDMIRANRLSGKTVKATIKKIRSVKVKPKKGRAKDLLRIEKLLKNITGRLPSKR